MHTFKERLQSNLVQITECERNQNLLLAISLKIQNRREALFRANEILIACKKSIRALFLAVWVRSVISDPFILKVRIHFTSIRSVTMDICYSPENMQVPSISSLWIVFLHDPWSLVLCVKHWLLIIILTILKNMAQIFPQTTNIKLQWTCWNVIVSFMFQGSCNYCTILRFYHSVLVKRSGVCRHVYMIG